MGLAKHWLLLLGLLAMGCHSGEGGFHSVTAVNPLGAMVRRCHAQQQNRFCPQQVAKHDRVVHHHDFSLGANSRTKFADWVSYAVLLKNIGSGKKRRWRADPLLEDHERLEPDDFKGAWAAIGVDRGHQAPLASFAGTPYWYETNYLSNVTPQFSGLNQGPWNHLEGAIRDLARGGEEPEVLTGPFYEYGVGSLPNADEHHVIPSGYWKVITVDDVGIGGTESVSVAFAFHQDTPRWANYCDYTTSLEDVQQRAHIALFPVQSDLYGQQAIGDSSLEDALLARLGC